jgi:enoyl-CoA hydratase/carnithine racemase
MQTILDAVTRGLETTLDQGLKIELEGVIRLWKTKDAKEGIKAFIEKREPAFTGE